MFRRSSGATFVEYLVIVALMAIVAVAILAVLFPSIALMLQNLVGDL